MISSMLLLALLASPKELNDAGMKAYRAKQLEKAVELFRQALEEDREDKLVGPTARERAERTRLRSLTHHNLACAQSLLRAKGQVCVSDNYRSSIVEHLLRSVELDPSRLERATTDPDLKSVRDTVGFQSLLGLSLGREGDLPQLLTRVRWWSPGVGVYGSLKELSFRADGTAELRTKRMSEDGRPLPPTVQQGKWKLQGKALTIEWPGGSPVQGRVTDTGLELDGTPFSDSPSECDA